MKKYVDPNTLAEYTEQVCTKHGLSDGFKGAILAQIRKMKEIYGEQIPRDDFLQIFGQQYESLKTGYKKKPVDIEEFLLSKEYFGLTNSLRPKVRQVLLDIFYNYSDKYEIVLGGSVGWGKTFTVFCAYGYQLYDISCLYSPYVHYNLAPGSAIAFTMQSTHENKIKKKFKEFKGLIDNSRYFRDHFPPQTKAKNYIEFPNNVMVSPLPTTPSAAISENLFSAFLDEVNFYKVVKGSTHQGVDEGYYDQARKIYEIIKGRIKTRFEDPRTGLWPGKFFIASSSQHKEDFVEQKKKEAKTSNHIYVAESALWESKDVDKYCGKKFWVQMPSEQDAGRILDKKPEIMNDDIIEVPVEHRSEFEENLHEAIRNVAGRPLERESKFIPSSALTENIENYNKWFDGQQIFSTQEVNINDVDNINSILNLPFIRAIDNFGIFHTHLDMAITHDSAGLAVGATMGSKLIEAKQRYDLDKEQYVVEDEYTAPIYVMFGLLRVNPPKSGQIELERMWKLYFALKEYLLNLRSFTGDYAYSTTISQILKKAGIKTDHQSVDKKADPYIETKTAFTEGRLWIPDHEKLKEEIKNVHMDATTGKIDHHKLSSKDVADAVAGTTYRLSKRKATYKKQGDPPTLKEMLKMAEEPKEEKKSTRPLSGNREGGWQQKRKGRSRLI